MNYSSKGLTYEEFHRDTAVQTRIIKKNNFTYRIIIDVLTKYLKKGDSILDIGCGAGTLSLYMASKGYDIYGIDISEKAIKACRQSAKILNLSNVSFKNKNFPNETLNIKADIVVCAEVLEHLKDDRKALEKIYLSLNKGGIAVITTPSKNAPLFRIGYARKFDEDVGHLRRYYLDELVNKCKQQGFLILETKKTEGILRNFLFINSVGGVFIRFIKFFVSDWVTLLDNILLKLFGESNIFVVVKKP